MNISFCWETKIFKVWLNSMIQYIQGMKQLHCICFKKIKKLHNITNIGCFVHSIFIRRLSYKVKTYFFQILFASNNLIFNNKTTNE
jgi:hypothetical protein